MFLGNKDLEAYKKDYSRWGIRAPKLVTLLSKQKEANFQRNRVWPSITKIRSELAITAVLNAVQVSADSDVAFQTLLSVTFLSCSDPPVLDALHVPERFLHFGASSATTALKTPTG